MIANYGIPIETVLDPRLSRKSVFQKHFIRGFDSTVTEMQSEATTISNAVRTMGDMIS